MKFNTEINDLINNARKDNWYKDVLGNGRTGYRAFRVARFWGRGVCIGYQAIWVPITPGNGCSG